MITYDPEYRGRGRMLTAPSRTSSAHAGCKFSKSGRSQARSWDQPVRVGLQADSRANIRVDLRHCQSLAGPRSRICGRLRFRSRGLLRSVTVEHTEPRTLLQFYHDIYTQNGRSRSRLTDRLAARSAGQRHLRALICNDSFLIRWCIDLIFRYICLQPMSCSAVLRMMSVGRLLCGERDFAEFTLVMIRVSFGAAGTSAASVPSA